MKADTIDELLHATPFSPFTVHIVEVGSVTVPHPDFAILTKGGHVLIVNTEGDRVKHISVPMISSITTEAAAA